MNINMIMAIGQNGVIGASDKGGGMPWNCPTDMKRFAALTKGDGNNILLMGRITAGLIRRPLPHRRNAVLSRSPGLHMHGYEVYGSLRAFLDAVCPDGKDSDKVWVIGGAQVYREVFDASKEIEMNINMHISWITGQHKGDTYLDPEIVMPTTLYKTQVMKTEIHEDHVYQQVKRFA